MSILGENLKIYNPFIRQPIFLKVFILLYIIIIFALFVAEFKFSESTIEFPFILLIMFSGFLFLLGLMVTALQLDILAKPFTFCLPNHYKLPRQIIFLMGIGIAFLNTMALSQLPFTGELKYLMLITNPVIVLAFYLLPVCFILYINNKDRNPFVLSSFGILAVLLCISFISRTDYYYSAKEIILYCFAPLLISTIFLFISAWLMLGEPDLKRTFHGKDSKIMAALFTSPMERTRWEEEISSLGLSKKPEQENVSLDWFFFRVKNYPYYSMHRSLWGYIYSIMTYGFGYINRSPARYFTTLIVLFSIILFLSGYQDIGGKALFFNVPYNWAQITALLCVCAMIEGAFRAPGHNQLLPVSRQQQFWIHLLIFISKPVLTVLWFTIIIAASWGLEHVMPDIKLMGYNQIYYPVSAKIIINALVFISVLSILFSFAKSLGLFIILVLGSSIVSGIILGLDKVHAINIQITMLILVFILNTLFITLLIWHWFRRDHS